MKFVRLAGLAAVLFLSATNYPAALGARLRSGPVRNASSSIAKPKLTDPKKLAKHQAFTAALANAKRRNAANATAGAGKKSGGAVAGMCGSSTEDGLPNTMRIPTEYCAHCRWCCNCNGNDLTDCEGSTVTPEGTGAVIFCNLCPSQCQNCPMYDDPALCPDGHCCTDYARDRYHQPPFDATISPNP